MAAGHKFKYQYQKSHIEATPYEGRQYDYVVYEKEGYIVRITLNRPEKRNVLNDAMLEDIFAALHQAQDDADVRVVIIRGAGTCFSTGLDLAVGTDSGEIGSPVHPNRAPCVREYYGFERRRCVIWDDIAGYPKPTIAQVHGYCLGAGGLLAGACDIVIATQDSQFGIKGFGEFTIGLYEHLGPWPAGSETVKAGRYTPEVSGKERAEAGLITKAVPADELEQEVNRWAEALASLSPEALAITKESINGILDVAGLGVCIRAHYEGHIAIQWVKWRKDEINFYKSKKDKGFRGFLEDRSAGATPSSQRH